MFWKKIRALYIWLKFGTRWIDDLVVLVLIARFVRGLLQCRETGSHFVRSIRVQSKFEPVWMIRLFLYAMMPR